jgi:hypothetical protein
VDGVDAATVLGIVGMLVFDGSPAAEEVAVKSIKVSDNTWAGV